LPAGLAVDGGLVFSDRRHAQNAADTASIAGAMAMIDEKANGNVTHDPAGGKDGYYAAVVLAAEDMAEENGYFDVVSTTSGLTCESASCGCAVSLSTQVISPRIDTSRGCSLTQLHNKVQASRWR
jgi:uncharacterized membrane protein